MGKDFMSLGFVKWVQFVSGSVGIVAVVVAMLKEPYRQPVLIGSAVLFGLLGLLGLHRYRVHVRLQGRLKGVVSSVHEITSFPLEANAEVFRAVETEYCYLGITFTSVLAAFRSWFERERRGSPKVRILVTDPDAREVLEYQARYELDLFSDSLTKAQQEQIVQSVERTRAAIAHALHALGGLPQAPGQIEVRYHREKLRKWAHYVNGREAYVGILRKGESGLKSPVLVLSRQEGLWTLSDHYQEEWESLWQEGRKAVLPGAGGKPGLQGMDRERGGGHERLGGADGG